jgi:predicted transcriptional regulator
MELNAIIQTLHLVTFEVTEASLQKQVSSACVSDMLSEVMSRAPAGGLWITHQNNENVIAIAWFKEVTAVLLANGVTLDEEVLEKARKKNIAVLGSSESAYELAGKLYNLGIRGHR